MAWRRDPGKHVGLSLADTRRPIRENTIRELANNGREWIDPKIIGRGRRATIDYSVNELQYLVNWWHCAANGIVQCITLLINRSLLVLALQAGLVVQSDLKINFWVFSKCVSRWSWQVFSLFLLNFGESLDVSLIHFSKRCIFFKKCRPTSFGFGASKKRKQLKKMCFVNHGFFMEQKSDLKSVSLIWGWFLASVLELRGGQNSKNSGSVHASLSGRPSGSFWDHFGLHFESVLGSFFDYFFAFFEDSMM